MKKIFIYIFMFCFILTAMAWANLDTKLIVPGDSVGGIKIGSKNGFTREQLIAKIGEPDLEQPANSGIEGQTNLIYHYDKDAEREYGLIFTIENNKVVSIKIEGPNGYSTGEGIQVGSSMKKVEKIYKEQIENGYFFGYSDPTTGWNEVYFPYVGIGFMGKYDAGKDDVLVTVIIVIPKDLTWKPGE